MSSLIERAGCQPPTAETIKPDAQVLINICHQLGCFAVPPGDYAGTNLAGLAGLPLESLTTSDLEKVTLKAAGFARPLEFVRKRSGTVQRTEEGEFTLCPESALQESLDGIINSILNNSTSIVGIRVTPTAGTSNDTKPSRPFQKILNPNDPRLIKDASGHIIGIYQRKDGDKYTDPYTFQPNDYIELFIEPIADVGPDGTPQSGGFIFQLFPDNSYNVFLTTQGIDVRHLHDSETINNGQRQQSSGNLSQPSPNHPVTQQFLSQDGHALRRLKTAIEDAYPGTTEILIEAHYAVVNGQMIVCAFDVEIPQKTAAQWRAQLNNKKLYPGGYNREILAPYRADIYKRFLFHQHAGD